MSIAKHDMISLYLIAPSLKKVSCEQSQGEKKEIAQRAGRPSAQVIGICRGRQILLGATL